MRRVLARTLLAACALGMAATLTGCSTSTTIEPSAGHSVVVSVHDSHVQEEALAEGTVLWGDGGCMVIELGHVDEIHLIVLPQGTTIGDNDEVTLPNGHVMSVGDEVALGGGFHSAATTKNDLSAIPEECLTEEVFWASGEVVK
jgi:hypothetical protein